MNEEIVYSLSAEDYSKFATRAGMALKSNGKKRATIVGLAEIATAVLGLMFYNGSLIYLLALFALFSVGLYQLCFYSLIFPKTITSKTYLSYKRANPEDKMLIANFTDDFVTVEIGENVREASYPVITLLYCEEAVVLTSYEWSAVIPREAVVDYDDFLEELKLMDFLEQRAI